MVPLFFEAIDPPGPSTPSTTGRIPSFFNVVDPRGPFNQPVVGPPGPFNQPGIVVVPSFFIAIDPSGPFRLLRSVMVPLFLGAIDPRYLLKIGMLIRLFQSSLKKQPLLTQVIASGVIAGGGDAFCQTVFEKRGLKSYDTMRTSRFVILASFFIAPSLNVWFKALERVKGSPNIVPLKRMIIDQTLFSPWFNALILLNLRLLEGISFKESYRKMKNDWWTIYKNSLKVWPAVQLINFYLIPLNMRIIVVQLVAFFWNSYLSFKTQKTHVVVEPILPLY
ncbi:Protein Mpv17 [Parelaphostrongylus tenuis]|uniref:Mitochondrial inner membrane protein Mpv17 n=1 Tax=Parelaphostrongylus tenuis TaxID=148309 RepID=A0AAD5R8Z3_PARTN|nr:Protein Mpv17 [Parelaphostrongylus tenuis]